MRNRIDYLKLFGEAQLGDSESFELLSRAARQRVYVYIFRLTLNEHLAEDVSQETLLGLVESFKGLKFENAGSLWSWLFKVALIRLRRYFRSQEYKGGALSLSEIENENLLAWDSGDYRDG